MKAQGYEKGIGSARFEGKAVRRESARSGRRPYIFASPTRLLIPLPPRVRLEPRGYLGAKTAMTRFPSLDGARSTLATSVKLSAIRRTSSSPVSM